MSTLRVIPRRVQPKTLREDFIAGLIALKKRLDAQRKRDIVRSPRAVRELPLCAGGCGARVSAKSQCPYAVALRGGVPAMLRIAIPAALILAAACVACYTPMPEPRAPIDYCPPDHEWDRGRCVFRPQPFMPGAARTDGGAR